jgi:hypothetical protein
MKSHPSRAFYQLYPPELGRVPQDTPALRARLMQMDGIWTHVMKHQFVPYRTLTGICF